MTQSGQADEQQAERLERFNRRKRVVDLVVSIASLPIAGPLFVLLSIGLMMRQGRPVLFSQRRLGYKEEVFSVYKFRTMTDDRDHEGNLLPDEDRITRFGAFMRRTSVDELPQLINILKGEMSLIGPRPLYPQYQPYYSENESQRHLVRPGLTGLAQVNGRNGLPWEERIALDVEYVRAASIWLDFRILTKTISKVLRGSGVDVAPGISGGRHFNMYRSFPEYEGHKLRPLLAGDLEARVAWISNPSTREFMSIEGDVTLESTKQWFNAHQENPRKHDFAVENPSGDVVAMVGMHDTELREGWTYVMVSPDQRGKGIGEVAQRLLYEWLFTHRGYNRVFSSVHKSNPASIRIHTKLGAIVQSETDDRVTLVQTEERFLIATGRTVGIRPL